MDRRTFMIGAGSVAGIALLPAVASAEANRIDWYMDSDTNVLDFWTNFIKPRFEAANPGITMNLVDAGDARGLVAIAERALAAKQTNTDPHADIFEEYDPRLPKGAIEAGLFVDFTKAGLSNYSRLNPLTYRQRYSACPCAARRCCSATTRPSSSPRTRPRTGTIWSTWIKANPEQFIYCRPDKGGSGQQLHPARASIRRTASTRTSSRSTISRLRKAKQMLDPAWEILKDIAPYTVRQGRLYLGQHPVGPASVARTP